MISYAQNFEDVMLWRALKNIENGFYIDVGANDSNIDSVTKVFYEQGWHGINIEPVSAHHVCLQTERPRDINLNCAAGSKAGEIEIWECEVRGWATSNESVIKQHIQAGLKGTYHKVLVRTLANICAEYVKGDIHFLKIDVEGFEKEVLMGADFQSFRPWIVVVEATMPNSTEQVYERWENLLTIADYLFAYADGLNRFYIAAEHSELLSALIYPPNAFDNFRFGRELNLEKYIQNLEAEIKIQQLKAEQAIMELTNVYASRSWRLTYPLRFISRMLSTIKQGIFAWINLLSGSRPQRMLKTFYQHAKLYINR